MVVHRQDRRVPLGLVAAGCALSGFALVRLGGILLSTRVEPLIYIVLVAEAVGALLNFWAARRTSPLQ